MVEPTVPGAAPMPGPGTEPGAPGPAAGPPGGPAPSSGASAPTDGSVTMPSTATSGTGGAGAASEDTVSQIIDAGADLLATSRDWVRQETEGIVREKVGKPLQEVGTAVGALWAAASLLVMGLIFIAVAALVWLSQLIGVPLAFLVVGAVYLVGSAVFLFVKTRQMRANAAALERSQELRGVAQAPTTRKATR
jgi:hypothetical protein